jgi:hypothetical protein
MMAPCTCGIWPQGVAKGRAQAQGNRGNLQRMTGNIAFPSCSALTGLAKRMLWALSGNRRAIPQARRVLAMMIAPVRRGHAPAVAGFGS